MNWMKHRLHDYKEPIDTIHLLKEFRQLQLSWNVYFNGKNLEYVEFIYRKIYGNQTYVDDQVETLKKNIDNVLSKADKLIIFA